MTAEAEYKARVVIVIEFTTPRNLTEDEAADLAWQIIQKDFDAFEFCPKERVKKISVSNDEVEVKQI